MSTIYENLPLEYRIAADPSELITVWRGDKIGRGVTGMLSRLGDVEVAQQTVLEAAGAGPEALNGLIDMHTDAHPDSPLVSVTTAIVRAQVYSRRPDETIYELRVMAARLLRDPHSIGSHSESDSTELLVIGGIKAGDIKTVKTNNQEWQASELLIERGAVKFLVDPWLDPSYQYDPSQAPNPAGIWDRSGQ